ncbi:MAG: hypothetical protein LC792_20890 [Actinobacteria bacterium]|nr:hypothetical protein [Actinomycetota bacterium]
MDDHPVCDIPWAVHQPDVVDPNSPPPLDQVAVVAPAKLGQPAVPFDKEFMSHQVGEPTVIVSRPSRHDLVMQLPRGGLHKFGGEHRVIDNSSLG